LPQGRSSERRDHLEREQRCLASAGHRQAGDDISLFLESTFASTAMMCDGVSAG
jgi:hypothetical protein